MLSFKFCSLSWFLNSLQSPVGIIHTGRWNLKISHSTFGVNTLPTCGQSSNLACFSTIIEGNIYITHCRCWVHISRGCSLVHHYITNCNSTMKCRRSDGSETVFLKVAPTINHFEYVVFRKTDSNNISNTAKILWAQKRLKISGHAFPYEHKLPS